MNTCKVCGSCIEDSDGEVCFFCYEEQGEYMKITVEEFKCLYQGCKQALEWFNANILPGDKSAHQYVVPSLKKAIRVVAEANGASPPDWAE